MRLAKGILLLQLSILSVVHVEDGRVVALKGSVSSEFKGQTSNLKVGSTVGNGASVSMAADALAVISLRDGTKLKLKEETKIQVHFSVAGQPEPTTVELITGALFSAVRKYEGQSFQIKTRSAVAGVRGTEFFT